MSKWKTLNGRDHLASYHLAKQIKDELLLNCKRSFFVLILIKKVNKRYKSIYAEKGAAIQT